MGDIFVLAGPNGGGKSSVGGRALLDAGGRYFNPDIVTRQLIDEQPETPFDELNSQVWYAMRDELVASIAEGRNFAFESTLGGSSITRILGEAAQAGTRVRVWFVALRNADLHIERVRARVSRGGHDIPDETIRHRFDASRANLQQLLPVADEIQVFDNTEPADLGTGARPAPRLLLHVRRGNVQFCCADAQVPGWAQEIVAAAKQMGRRE